MIDGGYFRNIIALIRWDADHYLPDGETESAVFMRVRNTILALQRKEETEPGKNSLLSVDAGSKGGEKYGKGTGDGAGGTGR